MARWWLAVAVFAGCYSPTTERPCKVRCDVALGPAAICPGNQECMGDGLCHTPGDPSCPAPEIDAPLADVALIDLPLTGPPYCFGSPGGLLIFCSPTLSNENRILAPVIHTDTDCTVTQSSGSSDVCVIYAARLTIAGDVRATGSRPLALVAVQTIDVQGTLDAGSRRIGGGGAGAGTGTCPAPQGPGDKAGAAGGTFQGRGGTGGNVGGAPGIAPPQITPTTVRGGCSGGDSVETVGGPGRGGGVLYLIAGSAIVEGSSGRLDVSGAGASQGDGGGAGGGAGGLIVLDAAGFQIAGDLMANGGGGASGSDGNVSASGDESSAPQIPGAGGASAGGFFGGPGSVGSSLAGGAGSGDGTIVGGGGGGGAGWIYYLGGSLAPTTRMSPPPVHLLP